MSEKEDILRRGRLAAKAKEVNDFTSSVQADRWIFPADLLVDRAHTVMLAKQGIIAKADAAAILKALAAIEKEGVEAVDIPAFEDVHMAIESKLIKAVGENAGGRMHSGRSRNDEVATCIRISARRELLELMADLLGLRAALLAVANENTDTIMPGFTHMQHAQPTTLAHHMLAHVSVLDRDFERLLDAWKFVNISPLGSAAFASTGFPLDREMTAKLLGFDRPMDNSMDGVAARDFILDLASRLAIIEVDLSRLADELVLWSTSEFGFVELSDTYASTSSIMPQKKNPDVLELVRGRSGTVIGHMVAAFTIVKGLPYSYNSDLQEVTPQLLRSFEITKSSVRIMTGAVQTITVKKDEMARKSTMGFTTATEIADTIVRSTGLPFRTAHGIVGRLAAGESSLARGSGDPSLGDVDDASMEMIGKKVSAMGLTKEMLAEAKDPAKNIERRNILGGPAKVTVRKKITTEKKKLYIGRQKLAVAAGKDKEVLRRAVESSGRHNGETQMIINGTEYEEGDRVRVLKDGLTYEGILMPSRSGNIVLKMKSGYNVGLSPEGSVVEFVEKEKAPSFRQAPHVHIKSKDLPQVSILSTGGTIASRVDYRTGAVSSQFTPDDIMDAIPGTDRNRQLQGRSAQHDLQRGHGCHHLAEPCPRRVPSHQGRRTRHHHHPWDRHNAIYGSCALFHGAVARPCRPRRLPAIVRPAVQRQCDECHLRRSSSRFRHRRHQCCDARLDVRRLL